MVIGLKMVTYIHKIKDCNLSGIYSVYSQTLEEDRASHYRNLDTNEGFLLASQDYYQYLSQIFFQTPGAVLAVYFHEGEYASALRLEPYRDGYLLSGLETAPKSRRKGYALRLVRHVIAYCKENGIAVIYSHIHKQNTASKNLHLSAGFEVISDSATLIDGTFSTQYETLSHRYIRHTRMPSHPIVGEKGIILGAVCKDLQIEQPTEE